MALNRDFIGRTYPPSEPYEVSRVKIKEFADAIGDPNPAYRDRGEAQKLGHPDVVAPPSFAIVVTMPASGAPVVDPDLGLDYSRVVHGEQRFSYARPIHAGDVLVATATVEDIRTAGRNELMTTRVDLATPDGEHVCTAYSSLVERGA